MTKNNKFLYLSMVVFIFQALQSNCQNRWIQSYFDDEDAVINSIIESYDHGYLLSGKHGANYSKYNWLIKTDINGDVLWEKTIGNGVNSIALHDLNKDNSGNMYLGGSTKAYDPKGDPLILKLNSCGEKEWCRVFYTDDNDDYSSNFTLTIEGDVVIILNFTNPEPFIDLICLAKIFSDGDLIWKQCYTSIDSSQRNEISYDIIQTPDNGFLVTGFCYYEDPEEPDHWIPHPYMLKVDSVGNFEWETVAFKETNKHGGWAESTVVSPDQQFYYSCGSHYHYDSIMTTAPVIMKMDMSGNIVNVYDIIDGYKYGGLYSVKFLNDTTLVANCHFGNTSEDIVTQVIKTDTLGNILDYFNLGQDVFKKVLDISYDDKVLVFYDVLQNDQFDPYLRKLNSSLEDDTIYTMPITYDSLCPYQIVSDTIVQDDCGLIVGIEEDDKTVRRYEGEGCVLEVWPNPASEGLSVKCLGLSSGNNSSTFNLQPSLVIYDIFGRAVTASFPLVPLSPGPQDGGWSWQMNVSALPPGIYLAVVRDERNVLGTAKFIIAR